MIEDKKYRQALIDRYLDAGTSVEEEIELAGYYAAHGCDADEAAVARLVLADCPVAAVLSESGAAEFDATVRRPSLTPARQAWLAAAAAAVALFFVIRPFVTGPDEAAFTPVEIAQSLNTMINLNLQDIESIVAEPKGAKVILTARMKDGSSSTFVMSREQEDGSTIILAQDKSKRKQ